MSIILALDQGTTSSRAVVFDTALTVQAIGQVEFEQIYPQPGWVEHDPETIWESQLAAVDLALAKTGTHFSDIACIGITNQRETTVVWDRHTGEAIGNAIVWQDRRTADLCERLRAAGHEQKVFERAGLVLDPYFSATKINWLLAAVDGARERATQGELAFGTIDSWLLWKLTNGRTHAIEISNASRTSLLNIRTGDWDDDLLQLFDVPSAMLPTVTGSSEVIAMASLGGRDDIPITGIAGDQQAALFGQTCFDPGDGKCTYGTGCFLLVNTGRTAVNSSSRLLTTIGWSIGDEINYALEGSVFIGGALVQWLRDNLGLIKSAPEIETLAASVSDSGGVTLVPAFAGLGAPYWDPHARGLIHGLTRGSGPGHIARAALEAIALQVCDLLDAMADDTGRHIERLRVDGGACANNLLMQLQADLGALTVQRAANRESTALGAAALAGLGHGLWSGLDDIRELWSAERIFEPQSENQHVRALRERWGEAVKRSMAWAESSG